MGPECSLGVARAPGEGNNGVRQLMGVGFTSGLLKMPW